jgi:hypothetical protein
MKAETKSLIESNLEYINKSKYNLTNDIRLYI